MPIASLPTRIALRILFAFGFGFFLSMFTRGVANIFKGHIQADLVLTEEALSLAVGTSFFVAFGLMQLPLGVLLDRFDPRKVNALLFSVAGLGAVIFAEAESSAMLSFGRVLMGVGFAGGMMGAMKTYTLWFPADKMPTLNGIQFAVGVLGAFISTKPTQLALEVMTWREVTLVFAGFTFLAAAIYLIVAPRHRSGEAGETIASALRGLGRVYTDPFFWRVTPWVALSMGISQGVGTLYVISWMTDVAGYTVSSAANLLMATSLIGILNFLVMGPVAEALGRRGFAPMWLPVAGVVASMAAMLLLVIQLTAIAPVIWIFWTVSIGANVLSFAAIARAFPVSLSGRAVTAVNLMGFAFTALSQWVVGYTLDLFPGDLPLGYQIAFGVLLATQVLGGIWYFLAGRAGFGRRTMVERLEPERVS